MSIGRCCRVAEYSPTLQSARSSLIVRNTNPLSPPPLPPDAAESAPRLLFKSVSLMISLFFFAPWKIAFAGSSSNVQGPPI